MTDNLKQTVSSTIKYEKIADSNDASYDCDDSDTNTDIITNTSSSNTRSSSARRSKFKLSRGSKFAILILMFVAFNSFMVFHIRITQVVEPTAMTIMKPASDNENNNDLLLTSETEQEENYDVKIIENDEYFSQRNLQKKQIELSNGISMEVIFNNNSTSHQKPPLVFIHGAFHAAWCWAEYYLPYFSEKGYEVWAFSLRGTNGTKAAPSQNNIKIHEYVEDISLFLEYFQEHESKNKSPKPVIIAHSMSSMYVMKYLEQVSSSSKQNSNNNTKKNAQSQQIHEYISGIISLAGVPPGGPGDVMSRHMLSGDFQRIQQVTNINKAMTAHQLITDIDLCRLVFFTTSSSDQYKISDKTIQRYQAHFKVDGQIGYDLEDLKKNLPSMNVDEDTEVALFLKHQLLSSDTKKPFRILIIGGRDDYVVDSIGTEDLFIYYGGNSTLNDSRQKGEDKNLVVDMVILDDTPHDIMLHPKWQESSDVIQNFLQR